MSVTDPADPVTEIMEPAPVAEPAAQEPADDNTVKMTREEYNQMMETNRSLSAIAPFANEIRNAIVSGQLSGTVTRGVQEQPTEPSMDEATRQRLNQDFFADPSGQSARIAQQIAGRVIQDTVAPREAALNAKYASMVVQNFISAKRDHPYYAAALPIFNQRVAELPMEQLGQGDATTLNSQLDFIWRNAVGTYVETRTDQIKKQKAAQIPTGAGGGGGAPKRTLQEIDAGAYNLAIAAGLPPEEIEALAAELGG